VRTPALSDHACSAEQRDVRSSTKELHHTVGTRLSGDAGGWSHDGEPVTQCGHLRNQDVLAWTLATDSGHTIRGSNSPNFTAGHFNDASQIKPTSIADLLWRTSLRDGIYGPSGNIQLRPGPDASPGSHAIGTTAQAKLSWKLDRH